MTLTLLNSSNTDISENVLETPKSNPYYFFFASISQWKYNKAIINITQANPVVVTVNDTSDVISGETISFSGVSGMTDINGLSGTISDVTGDNITVSIDSSGFSTYTSDGYVSVFKAKKDEIESAEEVRDKIAALKIVTGADMCHVIPRIDWTSSVVYDYYNPVDLDDKSFYVYSDGNIYACLENAGGAPSTVQPNGTNQKPFTSADGYTWKFVQEITEEDFNKFADANWLPLRPLKTYQQIDRNSIEAIHVDTRGTLYQHDDEVIIVGDGQGAKASIRKFFTGGIIHSIVVTEPGKNYTWASAYIKSSTGNSSKITPIISWGSGQVSEPVHDFNAKNIKFVFSVDGTENNSIYVGPIRTIGMLKPELNKLDSTLIDARSLLNVDANGNSFSVGDAITGQLSSNTAIVAGSDDTKIYYLEGSGSGFIPGEIVGAGSGKSAIIQSIEEFDKTKIDDANIIFIDNFEVPLVRNEEQLDTFTAVIGY